MTQIFANNAGSTLASLATNAATTLTLTDGAALPSPTGGDFCLLTLTQAGVESSWEIVKCTARSGNDLTVVRAQEGTTAVEWAAGTVVDLRVTAGALASINTQLGDIDAALQSVATSGVTVTGDLTLYVTQSTTLTITNYDSATAYGVSATGGTASITGDTITYTAGATAGTYAITINGRDVPVTVQAATFCGLIGTQGGQGFGVGEYNGSLPSGFSALTGTSDKAGANYGNYQYSDGSIMVFVPRFYYRIGNVASPRYAAYGANAIDIVGIDTFVTEVAANSAGYAMHRAFKDGGADRSGFFVDKYLSSKTSTTSCKSIANAYPISLTTNDSYNPSNGMTGCTGILADAVVLARSRAAGVFNVASIFMYDALAKLSLAHGQAASGTTHCAWYDAAGTTNFPKGCNNGALADANDSSVTYAVSYLEKPKTRATANFSKTTHNGQECGVADLNGSMYQVALGVTMAGTSATDSIANGAGNAYVLKTSVALASLTGGFGGSTDAWGGGENLATNYDLINGFLPWVAATGWIYYGNGANQVFSGATSGTDYLRSCSGIPALTGTNATGTSQFGNDGCLQSGPANLFPVASGYWSDAASAGVFLRFWLRGRSYGHYGIGFRAAAYGS